MSQHLTIISASVLGALAIGLAIGSMETAFADDKAPAAAKPAGGEAAEAKKQVEEEDPSKIVKQATAGEFKPSDDPPVGMQMNGMWVDKDGNPTPYIAKDGKPDWFMFSGYRRYGANCLQCHGPDGLGSSYAPSLADALKTLTYPEFLQTVASGKQDVSNSQTLVMPAFGDNKNVQCYINDIYVYLRARALGLWGRDQPSAHEEKPPIYKAAETACLGF